MAKRVKMKHPAVKEYGRMRGNLMGLFISGRVLLKWIRDAVAMPVQSQRVKEK